jgi:hypothetical protein
MEQLRHAQQQAHRDEQTQHMMREFARHSENMTSRLLERTSQTSHEQHEALRNHIAELTAASKRMQEAAERNAAIPPSLYSEHRKTQELVQRLLQQPQAQIPGLEGLTATLTNLVSSVSQGFSNLEQQQQQQHQTNLTQGATTQSQISVATNALHRQSHEMKDLLETLKAAVQLLDMNQAQHAAGVGKFAEQLGTHLGQQAAAAHVQAQLSAKVLEELRARRGQNTTLQQLAQILVVNNVPDTPENRQLALEYLQGGSSATSSTGMAGPPPQPKAPLQPMGVGGMSKKEEQESSAPLFTMDPMGQPIGHTIHDAGFAELTMATPKIIAAKTRKKMPMKYHRAWGTLATAVMKRKISAEEAVERLRRMRAQHIKKAKLPAPEQHEPTDDEGDNEGEAPMVPVSKRAKSPEEEGGKKRLKGKSRSPSIIFPDAPPPPSLNIPRPPSHPPPRPTRAASRSTSVRPSQAPRAASRSVSVRPSQAPRDVRPSQAPRGRSDHRSPPRRQQSPPV